MFWKNKRLEVGFEGIQRFPTGGKFFCVCREMEDRRKGMRLIRGIWRPRVSAAEQIAWKGV